MSKAPPHPTASQSPSSRGEKEVAPNPLPGGERVAAQRTGEGAYNPKPPAYTKPSARNLRKNQTDAEALLWSDLRNRRLGGYRFSRQVRIGAFIADFCCRAEKLIVELDGSQHAQSQDDQSRTRWLNRKGYAVLRFWNNEIMASRGAVLDSILAVLQGRITTPSPGLRYAPADLSPAGRG